MAIALGVAFLATPGSGRAGLLDRPRGLSHVSTAELIDAMRVETGYDVAQTTNTPRFQAGVLLRLARQAAERDPEGGPLWIGHEEWFRAFVAVLDRTPEQAPVFARLAFENGQDTVIEYRPERVIRRVREGPVPQQALAVVAFWPEGPGRPDGFSYEDVRSVPKLEVTIERVIRYRLLAWPDRIAYEEVEGLRGRPVSGLLGFLFRLLGKGSVSFSRFAVSDDGLLVTYTRAHKGPLAVTTTVTVQPDGVAEKDTPEGRPDLEALAHRLAAPVDVEYEVFPALP